MRESLLHLFQQEGISMRGHLTAGIATFGLVAALAGAACSERASMESGSTDADRTPITVTGCFQEASGFNNFVLTNVTEGRPEQRAQGYRIERGRETEQHVGKQVRVTGWVESDDTMQRNRTNSETQTGTNQHGTSSAAQDRGDRVGFNDYPELHVQSIERVGDNCGNPSGNPGR
jgi:hypothetical protein